MDKHAQHYIGIDIGTTSTIGILIALPAQNLAQAARPVTLYSPHQGFTEEDPEEWWQNLCQITQELLKLADTQAENIDALAVTGMLPALVLLDKNGNLLRRSIQQSDARCAHEVNQLKAEVNEDDFTQKTGNGINQQLLAGKLRWIETHEPHIFKNIATVCGSYDYINWKLTGNHTMERNWALEAGWLNIQTGKVDPELVKLAHLPLHCLPQLSAPHTIIGHLSAPAAKWTGLRQGTPITTGVADHVASAFMAGISQPGDVLLKFGGSVDILLASQKALPDKRFYMDYHIVDGLYVPNGCMATGGSGLNWFVNHLAGAYTSPAAKANESLHAYLDKLAAKIPPGSDNVQFLPYFLGEKTPIHDPKIRAAITGLSFNHTLPHLWRALLEAYAYALKHHIEVFNALGYPTLHYTASDGGAQSTLWMQLTANIIAAPIQLLNGHPGSCLGAAWTAAKTRQAVNHWESAANFVTKGKKILPQTTYTAIYNQGYHNYRNLYAQLKS